MRPEAPGKKVQRLDGGGFFVGYTTKGLRYSPELSPGILNRVVHNTAWIKIISSGYIQKKIVKKIEDCKVYHDGTVRDANKNIMQFLYGADGFNAKELLPTKHTSQPFFINLQNIAECLNAEAELLGTGTIGKLRVLKREEVDLMVSFIQVGAPGFQTEVVERATFNIKTILRVCVAEIKIYEYMIPMFCRKIKDEFEEAKAKMGYMAGLVAASSIGEPTTQMTLNSLDWKELIYVRSGSSVILEPIGKFIDGIIDTYPDEKIERMPNRQLFVDVSHMDYEMTSVDEDGKMHWKKLEAVTRHLPGGKLIKVRTHFGREVVATKGMSFLTRKKNKLVPTLGSDLKVGSYLPVMLNFPETKNELEFLDLRTYLDPKAYIYTSEMNKAWKIREKGKIGWFKKNGVKFTIPYNRSDSFYTAYNRSVLTEPSKFKKGCVYPKSSCMVVSRLPEFLPLDFSTGFLFGAHIAEGCVTKTFVCISNNDESFRNMIYDWCDKYKIGYHTVTKENERFEGSKGTDIKIHSTMMAKILGEACGKGSANKKIPEWSLIAPKEFIRGLLNGYFSGDGTVEKRSGNIKCASSSMTLIKGISELLAKFGIYGYIYTIQLKSNNVGSKVILPSNVLELRGNNSNIFATEIGSVVPDKADRMENITLKKDRNYRGEGRNRKIPIYIDGKEKVLHISEIYDLEAEAADEALDQDVYYDEIVSIEEVECSTEYVYDVTVADTKNFATFGGIQLRDTFHSTGQSAKDVTLGVPRLKELLNVAKKPSKPTCSIFLNDDKLKKGLEARKATKEEETIKKIDSECLRHTAFLSTMFAEKKVKHFMKSYDLKYVPTEKGKVPKSSPIGLISYKEYEPSWWVEMSKKLIDRKSEFEANIWVIIIELDINLLYINTVTPSEIASKIEEEYGDRDNAFCCIASPICIGQIEVYINFTEIGSYTRDRLSTDKGNLLNSRNIDYFTVRDVAINLIESVVISGISGITKTYVHQKPDTGEWTIDTQGTALTQLLAHPLVDSTRTISDNIWEVYRIFGIEATRKFLIREITKILSFDGTYINPRHITLLVDAMCRTGYPTSVNRDGIARDVGPLAKGMFEKAVENFAESAAFGEHDIMQGVSAAVMMGTAPFVGTGTVDIKDEDTLPVIRY